MNNSPANARTARDYMAVYLYPDGLAPMPLCKRDENLERLFQCAIDEACAARDAEIERLRSLTTDHCATCIDDRCVRGQDR